MLLHRKWGPKSGFSTRIPRKNCNRGPKPGFLQMAATVEGPEGSRTRIFADGRDSRRPRGGSRSESLQIAAAVKDSNGSQARFLAGGRDRRRPQRVQALFLADGHARRRPRVRIFANRRGRRRPQRAPSPNLCRRPCPTKTPRGPKPGFADGSNRQRPRGSYKPNPSRAAATVEGPEDPKVPSPILREQPRPSKAPKILRLSNPFIAGNPDRRGPRATVANDNRGPKLAIELGAPIDKPSRHAARILERREILLLAFGVGEVHHQAHEGAADDVAQGHGNKVRREEGPEIQHRRINARIAG